jgi:hypothetical protein
MSLWTDIRDTWENVATLGLYNPKDARQKERDQRDMINDQIKAYKDQTELTRQQIDATRAQTDVAKRQIQEKQIRALRRNYRTAASGLLGVGASSSQDMNTNLGG